MPISQTLRRAALAAAVLLVVAGAAAPFTVPGRRALGALDRRLGITPAGQQARFQALLAQGEAQYRREAGERGFRRVDYPEKERILADRDRTLTAIREGLLESQPHAYNRFAIHYPYDPRFLLDLLLSLGQEPAREVLMTILEQGHRFSIPGLADALRTVFSDAELKEMALTLPAWGAHRAYWAVSQEERNWEFVQAFVLHHDHRTEYRILNQEVGTGRLPELFPRLSRRGRLAAIEILRWEWERGSPQWQALWSRETDPAVRQELLFQAGNTPALLAAIERDGAFQENRFWEHWAWMKEAAAAHPDSFLAQGIQAYETVRGRPYFELDRIAHQDQWPRWEYGNRYYEPDQEIPGWLAFLEAYRRHPAADDAAYRLGRSYEMRGEYAAAVRWLHEATRLPDGGRATQARDRVVWILDALLDEAEMEQLAAANPVPELQPYLTYTQAVKALRAGRYQEAAAELTALLNRHQETSIPWPWPHLAADPDAAARTFWQAVGRQRDQAAQLRDLAAQGTPESHYELAATMYHDELLFYNHLWAGNRSDYLQYWHGHALEALQGDMDPAYTRWIAGMNNYIQAAQAFAALADAPPPVAARAAYSRGLALTRLLNYGEDVTLWQRRRQIHAGAVAAFQEVAERYPRHELADDALLSLGFLQQEPRYFEQILAAYPDGDAAVTARQWLGREFPPSGLGLYSRIPFRYLHPAEAPPSVATWVQQHQGKRYTGTRTVGPYTYALISTDTDRWIDVSVREDPEGNTRVSPRGRSRPGGTGWVLVRFRQDNTPVVVAPAIP